MHNGTNGDNPVGKIVLGVNLGNLLPKRGSEQ